MLPSCFSQNFFEWGGGVTRVVVCVSKLCEDGTKLASICGHKMASILWNSFTGKHALAGYFVDVSGSVQSLSKLHPAWPMHLDVASLSKTNRSTVHFIQKVCKLSITGCAHSKGYQDRRQQSYKSQVDHKCIKLPSTV